MSENQTYNQTRFSLEEPILQETQLPEPDIDLEKLDEEISAAVTKRKRISLMILAIFIIFVGLIWVAMSMPQIDPSNLLEDQTPVPTIIPAELTLREQIDLLIDQVDQSNRPSQSLVFPPVEPEIRIENK